MNNSDITNLISFVLNERFLFTISIIVVAVFLLSVFFLLFTVFLRLINMWKFKHWSYLEKVWSPVLLDILTGDKVKEDLWHHVANRDRVFFINFLFRYILRLKGEETAILTELAKPYVHIIAPKMKSKNPEIRANTIKMVSILAFDSYSQEIISSLEDPSPLVSMVTARSIARQGKIEYSKNIIRNLYKFENWSSTFIGSMIKSMGPEILPELRSIFADQAQSPRIRISIAEALQQFNDFQSADIAAMILEKETEREVINAALRLLRFTGRAEHLNIIRKLYESDDAVVRSYVVQVLGYIGNKDDVGLLKKALDDPSPWVSIHATMQLMNLKEFDILQDIASSDHSRAVLAKQVLMEKK